MSYSFHLSKGDDSETTYEGKGSNSGYSAKLEQVERGAVVADIFLA